MFRDLAMPLLILFLQSGDRQRIEEKTDPPPFAGEWLLTEANSKGHNVETAWVNRRSERVFFTPSKVTYWRANDGQPFAGGTYVILGRTGNLYEIDLKLMSPSPRSGRGTVHALLEVTGDRMLFAYSFQGVRPTNFEPSKEGAIVILRYSKVLPVAGTSPTDNDSKAAPSTAAMGEWKVVSAPGSEPAPVQSALRDDVLVFTGKKFGAYHGDNLVKLGVSSPSTKFGAIWELDTELHQDPGGGFGLKHVLQRGLFRIDGDNMIVAWGKVGGDRPSSFEQKELGAMIAKYKRVLWGK